LARSSRERTWWSEYRDVMRSDFVGLEAGATAMRSWDPMVMPGLLQTEEYTRSLLAALLPAESPSAVEKRIALRLTRQRRLTGHHPLRLTAVIDESVLYRVIGGDECMAGQLRRVREVAGLSTVSVRIRPLTAGAHRFLGGAAAILEFGGTGDPDVLFMEGLVTDWEKRPVAVARSREAFDRLSAGALDERASLALIDRLITR
jgi:hypothetical protein